MYKLAISTHTSISTSADRPIFLDPINSAPGSRKNNAASVGGLFRLADAFIELVYLTPIRARIDPSPPSRISYTDLKVQHWLDDDDAVQENEFVGITLSGLRRLHFINGFKAYIALSVRLPDYGTSTVASIHFKKEILSVWRRRSARQRGSDYTHRSATIGGTEKRYRPDHRDDHSETTAVL